MMSQALMPDSSQEVDLRQIVISNSTFGPNEITHIVWAISSDYNNFRLLRDADSYENCGVTGSRKCSAPDGCGSPWA